MSAPPSARTLTFSMPCRSIVMAATLRVSSACEPLADSTISSPTLEPLNCSVSVPAAALDRVAAVARIPAEDVVAVAQAGGVVAAVAVDEVVAAAAQQDVVAVAAAGSCRCPRRRPASAASACAMPFWPAIVSLPSPPLTSSCSTLVTVDGRRARREDRDVPVPSQRDADHVVAAGAAGGDGVDAGTAVDHEAIADALVLHEDLGAQPVDHRGAGVERQRIVARSERRPSTVSAAPSSPPPVAARSTCT